LTSLDLRLLPSAHSGLRSRLHPRSACYVSLASACPQHAKTKILDRARVFGLQGLHPLSCCSGSPESPDTPDDAFLPRPRYPHSFTSLSLPVFSNSDRLAHRRGHEGPSVLHGSRRKNGPRNVDR